MPISVQYALAGFRHFFAPSNWEYREFLHKNRSRPIQTSLRFDPVRVSSTGFDQKNKSRACQSPFAGWSKRATFRSSISQSCPLPVRQGRHLPVKACQIRSNQCLLVQNQPVLCKSLIMNQLQQNVRPLGQARSRLVKVVSNLIWREKSQQFVVNRTKSHQKNKKFQLQTMQYWDRSFSIQHLTFSISPPNPGMLRHFFSRTQSTRLGNPDKGPRTRIVGHAGTRALQNRICARGSATVLTPI